MRLPIFDKKRGAHILVPELDAGDWYSIRRRKGIHAYCFRWTEASPLYLEPLEPFGDYAREDPGENVMAPPRWIIRLSDGTIWERPLNSAGESFSDTEYTRKTELTVADLEPAEDIGPWLLSRIKANLNVAASKRVTLDLAADSAEVLERLSDIAAQANIENADYIAATLKGVSEELRKHAFTDMGDRISTTSDALKRSAWWAAQNNMAGSRYYLSIAAHEAERAAAWPGRP